jgi:hypothetical protein
VIVSCDPVPPVKVDGESDIVLIPGCWTRKVSVTLFPFKVAVTVTAFVDVTAVVDPENVTEVFPASMVALDGTLTAESPLASATTIPPAGADCCSVTRPVNDVPPETDDGVMATVESW